MNAGQGRRSMSSMALIFGAAVLLPMAQYAAARAEEQVKEPEIAIVAPGLHRHRVSGEFLKDGFPVDAPAVDIRFDRPVQIMKYQVSRTDYGRCIADKDCGFTFRQVEPFKEDDSRPVTGVSYIDARNYAQWLSRKTGVTWRLPTDAEWAYAAGSRYFDDATGIETDAKDPSKRMLSKYRQAVELNRDADPVIKPPGTYGANEHGVFDQAGNVWEWTETCYSRSIVGPDGTVRADEEGNCGVRVIEGRHRSYMTFFVQDAKSGGCAVGTPPDYLGIRLVKEQPPFFSLQHIRDWLGTRP